MKTLTRLFLLALCVLLCLSACKEDDFVDTHKLEDLNLITESHLTVQNTESNLPEVSFSAALTDAHGAPLPGESITLSVGEQSAVSLTDESGVAVFSPELEQGQYEATFSFAGTTYHKPSSASVTLSVEKALRRTGVYVKGTDWTNINFEELSAAGVENIFLREDVLDRVSALTLQEQFAEAKEAGIRVHLWMLAFHENARSVSPIILGSDARPTENQAHFDRVAARVRRAAALEGLSGIHFDYLRFDGETVRADDAKWTNGHQAINEFVRQMTTAARAINPDLIFSATIKESYVDLLPIYGQSVKDLSAYLDFFVPMVYTGLRTDGSSQSDLQWAKECLRLLCQQYPDAEFWTALMTYQDDANINVIKETQELYEEIVAVKEGGSDGVVLFYYNGKGSAALDALNHTQTENTEQ